MHEIQRDGGRQVLDLLGEGVGQPGQAAHAHPHGEIRALHIAGGDAGGVRVALDGVGPTADALGGAVALLPFRWAAVQLHELRVIDAGAERILDRGQVQYSGRRLVEVTATEGHTYWTTVDPVPRIPSHYIDAVIYMYRSRDDAARGAPGGSGFLVRVKSEKYQSVDHLYAVTARHVTREKACVVRAKKKSLTAEDDTAIIEIPEQDWHHHPHGDDVSLAEIKAPELVYALSFIDRSTFLPETRQDLVGPGDEVFWVGRFLGHDGKERHLPSVRFGNVSMLPSVPVKTEHGIGQESYIVEARSLSGYSGSPVYVYYPEVVSPRLGFAAMVDSGPRRPPPPRLAALGQARPLLLGLDWGHLHDHARVLDKHKNPTAVEMYVRFNTGMMTVLPAWKILELLDSEELFEERRQEGLRRTRESPATLDGD